MFLLLYRCPYQTPNLEGPCCWFPLSKDLISFKQLMAGILFVVVSAAVWTEQTYLKWALSVGTQVKGWPCPQAVSFVAISEGVGGGDPVAWKARTVWCTIHYKSPLSFLFFWCRIAKPGHFSLREHLSLLKGSQKLSVLIGGGISSTVLNGAFSWPLCGPSSLWFIQQVFLKSFLWTWHHATSGDIENSNSLCHIGALQYSRRDKCWSVYK